MVKYRILLLNILSVGLACAEVPSVISNVTQVIKPVQSIVSYEVNQVPAESGVYFQAVVNGYNARVKRDMGSRLKQNASQGNAHAKELLYLFEQLPFNTTVRQVITLLTRAISAHKDMVKENAGHQDVIDRNDRVYMAILLQSCVVLTNAARDQLLGTLEEINNSLAYWREQKNHPTKYFFHKSPLKWVLGKSQIEEITSNIKKLERLEFSMRSVLGRMTKHLYEFNPSSTSEASYAWINELFSILACIGAYEDKKTHDAQFDDVAEQLRFMLGRVGNLKNNMLARVASAQKAGHFVRNWMAYTAAIIAAYQARNYYLENTDSVIEYIGSEALKGYRNWIQEYIRENAIIPISNIFISKAPVEFEKKEIETTKKRWKDLLDRLTGTVPSLFYGPLGKLANGETLSADQVKEILDAEAAGDLAPWHELWYKIPLSLFNYDDMKEAILIYIDLKLYHGEKFAKEELDALNEQFRVTKNLAILAPTILASIGAGVGLHKLYNWFTARDYSAVRLALIEINSLFIESAAPLSDYDYGKLIFLLQGLKSKATRYLPKQDNIRDDFLSDIAKLESQQFTVETKRKIIKNMFRKYPFLSLNVKTA